MKAGSMRMFTISLATVTAGAPPPAESTSKTHWDVGGFIVGVAQDVFDFSFAKWAPGLKLEKEVAPVLLDVVNLFKSKNQVGGAESDPPKPEYMVIYDFNPLQDRVIIPLATSGISDVYLDTTTHNGQTAAQIRLKSRFGPLRDRARYPGVHGYRKEDVLIGDDANNVLVSGIAGTATMTGNVGADVFMVNGAQATITDYNANEGDQMEVETARYRVGEGVLRRSTDADDVEIYVMDVFLEGPLEAQKGTFNLKVNSSGALILTVTGLPERLEDFNPLTVFQLMENPDCEEGHRCRRHSNGTENSCIYSGRSDRSKSLLCA
eukprot:Clim_evm2s30 gene=Clim_evmTU2s30